VIAPVLKSDAEGAKRGCGTNKGEEVEGFEETLFFLDLDADTIAGGGGEDVALGPATHSEAGRQGTVKAAVAGGQRHEVQIDDSAPIGKKAEDGEVAPRGEVLRHDWGHDTRFQSERHKHGPGETREMA
jgi:hypothetical protein